jgi:hypothetical protein
MFMNRSIKNKHGLENVQRCAKTRGALFLFIVSHSCDPEKGFLGYGILDDYDFPVVVEELSQDYGPSKEKDDPQ